MSLCGYPLGSGRGCKRPKAKSDCEGCWQHAGMSREPCMICMDILGDSTGGDDKPVRLPCGHRFHRICFRGWTLRGNLSCPLCRHPTNAEPETLQPIPASFEHVVTAPRRGEVEVTGEECSNVEWLIHQLNIVAQGMKHRDMMSERVQIQVATDMFYLKAD